MFRERHGDHDVIVPRAGVKTSITTPRNGPGLRRCVWLVVKQATAWGDDQARRQLRALIIKPGLLVIVVPNNLGLASPHGRRRQTNRIEL